MIYRNILTGTGMTCSPALALLHSWQELILIQACGLMMLPILANWAGLGLKTHSDGSAQNNVPSAPSFYADVISSHHRKPLGVKSFLGARRLSIKIPASLAFNW